MRKEEICKETKSHLISGDGTLCLNCGKDITKLNPKKSNPKKECEHLWALYQWNYDTIDGETQVTKVFCQKCLEVKLV